MAEHTRCRGWPAEAVRSSTAQTWENGYVECFNGKLRDELLNGELFYSVKEAKVLIESWRRHDNTVRPHGSLGYRPPSPFRYGRGRQGRQPSARAALTGRALRGRRHPRHDPAVHTSA